MRASERIGSGVAAGLFTTALACVLPLAAAHGDARPASEADARAAQGEGALGAGGLLGEWYLLVHIAGSSASSSQDAREPVGSVGPMEDVEDVEDDARPDAARWDERVWRFERRGRRLLWTEYPIVGFDDETGRFERLEHRRVGRTPGHWEPSAAQQREIRAGLELSDRSVRTKALRGDDERGWTSAGDPRADSASVVGYHESWQIEEPAGLPVFTRVDSMGSGRTGHLSATTHYRVREVVDGGAELRGEYERDAERGRFRMWRAGAPPPGPPQGAAGEGTR